MPSDKPNEPPEEKLDFSAIKNQIGELSKKMEGVTTEWGEFKTKHTPAPPAPPQPPAPQPAQSKGMFTMAWELFFGE